MQKCRLVKILGNNKSNIFKILANEAVFTCPFVLIENDLL